MASLPSTSIVRKSTDDVYKKNVWLRKSGHAEQDTSNDVSLRGYRARHIERCVTERIPNSVSWSICQLQQRVSSCSTVRQTLLEVTDTLFNVSYIVLLLRTRRFNYEVALPSNLRLDLQMEDKSISNRSRHIERCVC